MNIHPVYLSRLFSRNLGITFRNHLITTRLNKASELLRNSQYKVYEISEIVGYEKPRHFSEIFKERFGMTPLEYRGRFLDLRHLAGVTNEGIQ